MLQQVLKFGGVGVMATLVHVISALAARSFLQVDVQQANLIGFVLAFVVSYTGHARVTFNAPMRSGQQLSRFMLVAIMGFAASSAVVWVVTGPIGFSFPAAMAAVAVIVPAISFVSMRMWVFADQTRTVPTSLPDLALVGAIAVAVLAVYWGRLVNHDIAWYLFATRDWLGGAQLYVDIVEVNPPLNFYLTVPALALADLLGIADHHGHMLAVALLLASGLYWSGRVLLVVYQMSTLKRLAFLLGAAVAVVIPTLNGLGQREQILVISFLPWALIEASRRPVGRGQTLAAALFAAVGMCLKPHFVALPLAVTVLNCAEARSFRPILAPANLVFLAVGTAYVVYVWAVHPAYLFQVAPAAMWVYGAFGKPMPEVLAGIGQHLALLALLVIVARRTGALTREVRLFAALAAGGALSYLLQGTGFAYHKVPFLAFTAAASFFLLLQANRTWATGMIATLTVVAIVGLGVNQGFYRNRPLAEITKVTDELGPINRLITLSSQIHTGPPIALALGADWASGYPHNWLVPGAVNRLAKTDCTVEVQACARLEAIAAQNRTANIRDIDRLQPDLLIIDQKSAVFDKPGFDWLAFLDEDPAWAPVFAGYRKVAESRRFVYFYRTSP